MRAAPFLKLGSRKGAKKIRRPEKTGVRGQERRRLKD